MCKQGMKLVRYEFYSQRCRFPIKCIKYVGAKRTPSMDRNSQLCDRSQIESRDHLAVLIGRIGIPLRLRRCPSGGSLVHFGPLNNSWETALASPNYGLRWTRSTKILKQITKDKYVFFG